MTTRKPARMKPVRGYAVFREDGSIPEIGSRLAISRGKNPLRGWKIEPGERIVPVEIRELPRKRTR